MRSLRTKILVILLISVFAAAVLISGAGFLCAEKVIGEDSRRIMELTCEDRVKSINSVLLAIEQSVKTDFGYADSLLSYDSEHWSDVDYIGNYCSVVGELLRNTAKNTEGAVSVYLRLNPEVSSSVKGIFLMNLNGRFEASIPADITLYPADDISHVGWYYQPIKNGGPMWLEPYYNENIGINMITYAAPLYRGDTVIGVIGMDVELSILRKKAGEIALYDTGCAFLVGQNGDIIYHRDYPEGIEKSRFDSELTEVSALITDDNEGRLLSYKWRGQDMRFFFKKLANGMRLGVTAPSSEINIASDVMTMQTLIVLPTILLIAGMAGYFLVKRITKPLAELTSSARKIAGGDWDAQIKCDSSDEVGVLAAALRDTISELKKYINNVSALAYTDNATGAGNDQAYNEQIMRLEQSIENKTARFCIVVMDIDDLNNIRETYGRETGNSFISAASTAMKKHLGRKNLYRIGDNSFVALIPDAGESEAFAAKQNIDRELEEFNRKRNTCSEELKIMFGFAAYDRAKDASYEDVYGRADKMLCQSRNTLSIKRGMFEDSLKMLQMVFHKILRANLTQDTYYEIKTYEDEKKPEKGYRRELSGWLTEFARSGQVHDDDKSEYLAFVNTEEMKRRLRAGEGYLSVRYRRKVNEEFRWVQMEIVTSVEYTNEEQIVLLYVRDIHESYTAELEYQKELERISNTDTLTGLYNRHYLTIYCKDYVMVGRRNVGVVFCDLNGLKYANDHFGHTAGDDLIISLARVLKESFPEDMCCRMSGDEFIVCVFGKSEESFMQRVSILKRKIIKDGRPLASVGVCWQEAAENIGSMINEAENEMYKDKQLFYEKFPMYRR